MGAGPNGPPVPFGIALEPWRTELAQEERLVGVLTRLRQLNKTVETLDTFWLVGCDGAHSVVRHHNRDHFIGTGTRRGACVLSGQGAAMVFPLLEGRHLLMANLEEPARDHSTPSLEALQGLVDGRIPGALLQKQPLWRSNFWIHYRLCRYDVHGRTLLAGDAVNVHIPFGSQVMNIGIQDAFNLARKLALVVRGLAPQAQPKS